MIDLSDPFLEVLYNDGDVVLFLWKNEFGWPIEFVSKNVAKLLDYKDEDFYSTLLTYSDLIHPEDIDRVYEETMDHSGSDTTSFHHKHYRLRKRSGEYINIFDSTVIIRDEDGEIKYYLGHIGPLINE